MSDVADALDAMNLGDNLRCPGVHERPLPVGVLLENRTKRAWRYRCPDKYGCGLEFEVLPSEGRRYLRVLSERQMR